MTKRTLPAPLLKAFITISVMLSTVMQALDTTIANVALPDIKGTMSATQDQVAWVLTSYIVAAAIATPLTGFLAARFGRKRLFVLSVAGFTITSMLCGAAHSLPELVIFRLLQGIFGASLVPFSQAVLLDTFPPEKHATAMSFWGMGVMIGPILGPTLGGYLTQVQDWRWVFYINLPFGLLALAGILFFVPETEPQRERRFDLFGFTLLALAIGLLQMVLDRGQSEDWLSSTEIISYSVIAAVAFYMFVVHIFTADEPFIEPGMFYNRNFALGLCFIFVIGIVLLATLALLPPFLQSLMGYPVLTTGLLLAPRGVGSFISMVIIGRLNNRIDPRILLAVGLSLVALSLYEMSGFNLYVNHWIVIRSGLTQGLGLGMIIVPLSTISFATLAPKYRHEGTAMFSLMRNIGSSIGISIVMTLLARNTQRNHSLLGEVLTPFNSNLSSISSLMNPETTSGALMLNTELTRQASAMAFISDFQLMTLVTLMVMPLLLLLHDPMAGSDSAKESVADTDLQELSAEAAESA